MTADPDIEKKKGKPGPGSSLPVVLLAVAILGFITFLDYASQLLIQPRVLTVFFTILSASVLLFVLAMWKQKKFGAYGFTASVLLSFALKITFGERIGFSLWEPLSLTVLAVTLREHWANWR